MNDTDRIFKETVNDLLSYSNLIHNWKEVNKIKKECEKIAGDISDNNSRQELLSYIKNY